MWTNSMVIILQYTSDQSNVWYTLSLHGICQLYLKILNEFFKNFHWVEHLEMANSIHSGMYLKKKQIQVRSVVVAAVVQLLSCVQLLWPHGLQHSRPPCPSLSPRVGSNLCPLSQWCHPTIASSVISFSPCLQSFPASGSFPVSQLFESGGQTIGASALASVLPMNIQDWFPLGLTGLILQSKGLSRVFSNTTVWRHPFFGAQLSLWSNA